MPEQLHGLAQQVRWLTLCGTGKQLHRRSAAATMAVQAPLLALMISTVTRQGHRCRKSRLYLMTVARYWLSSPYLLRSRFVLYCSPSLSVMLCFLSSSGTLQATCC